MSEARPVPMEELLVHRQWVRALARRLAADESSADDLEQATWLAAVEKPPADARSTRGWLGTVLRNVHRNSLRGAARRGERELAATRREPPQTADELVAEAETQHALVREVLALDEPYRSTVLLRWYEDLTPTAIAERTGVPLDTVKTRLRRAVERLRERMDDRFRGDRRAWCLLAMGSGERVPTATAAVMGGVAMGVSTKLTIAAVALVALGAATWWARSDGAPVAGAAAETAEADVKSSPPASDPKPARSASRTPETAPAASAASVVDPSKPDRDLDLHGVIVRSDGSGVVGARVQAIDYPWRRTMTVDFAKTFEGRPGASTASAEGGVFALRLHRGDATVLRVSADGLATRESGPFQAGERVRITMTPAVKLHVTVKDEAGAPLSGATLSLFSGFGRGVAAWSTARATTDASGRCDFDGLSGGVDVMLIPASGVGDFRPPPLALPATGEMSVNIVSPKGRTIRGRVFDAVTLAPVAGATVGVGPGGFCSTTSDGGGRFEVRGWTETCGRDLLVMAAGYPRTVAPVAASDAVNVPLSRGFAATGRVVDADGSPVAGACVAAEASKFEGRVSRSSSGYVETDATGRFRVADLDRGLTHSFSAFAPSQGRVRRDVAPPRAGEEAIDVGDLRLGPSRTIAGRVLDAESKPLAGVELLLHGPGESAAAQNGGDVERRRTDDLGRFAFGDLGPGDYSVDRMFPDATPVSTKVTLPADRDVLDVDFQPKSQSEAVTVTVMDPSGAPVTGIHVSGQCSERDYVRAETDAAGRAVLDPPTGRVSLISVGGYSEGWLRVAPIAVEPGRHDVALVMERGVLLTCRVLDADGAPLPRASVAVVPAGRSIVFSMPKADGAWTDDDGLIRVLLPRDGDFTLVSHGVVYDEKRRKLDSLLEAREEHVTAQTGDVTLRCRRVETGRSVTVVVFATDGSPVADTVVHLTSPAAIERKAKTDAAGRATFEGLPAREFQAATSPALGPLRSLVASSGTFVPAGQEVVIRNSVPVTITGTVVGPDGAPAGEASVTVLAASLTVPGEATAIFWASTDKDGRFTVQVPADDPREFRIDASGSDRRTSASVKVATPPQTGDVRIELTPSSNY